MPDDSQDGLPNDARPRQIADGDANRTAQCGFCVWSRRAGTERAPPPSFPVRPPPRSRIKSGGGSLVPCENRTAAGRLQFIIMMFWLENPAIPLHPFPPA